MSLVEEDYGPSGPDFTDGKIWYDSIKRGDVGDLVSFMMHGADVTQPVNFTSEEGNQFVKVSPIHFIVVLGAHEMLSTFINGGGDPKYRCESVTFSSKDQQFLFENVNCLHMAIALNQSKVLEIERFSFFRIRGMGK
eukprot:TRINITY_DN3177_c0_g1_i2.p1 TRINITY_DN3177_c0_g1~~TRINITY_DN3177_c0_g1_i2.p1  ORF type:complete len:137 (+),score=51.06 TRINITY_DN3177_c0_g1_i2:52-462(+)